MCALTRAYKNVHAYIHVHCVYTYIYMYVTVYAKTSVGFRVHIVCALTCAYKNVHAYTHVYTLCIHVYTCIYSVAILCCTVHVHKSTNYVQTKVWRVEN